MGEPRITYVNRTASPQQKEVMVASMRRAVSTCAPFPLSPQLGKAVAGRIFFHPLRYPETINRHLTIFERTYHGTRSRKHARYRNHQGHGGD